MSVNDYHRMSVVKLSKKLLDSWARAAHQKLSDANNLLDEKKNIPSEQWIRNYLHHFPKKFKDTFRNEMVGDNSFLSDRETKMMITAVLEQDAKIKPEHSEFIPLTARALQFTLAKGFEVK